ncbi:MAG: hypothetical protein IJO48_05420 [Clostridia bacterium]|nr:hypothetical protein [Clostridia bacterium]
MFDHDELQKLRDGGNEAFKNLYKKYSSSIYREALIAYDGDKKRAAKKVWDTFYRLWELVKNDADDQAVFGVFTHAESAKNIEEACMNTVWRSLSGVMDHADSRKSESSSVAVSNANDGILWTEGIKLESVAEHSAHQTVQNVQTDQEQMQTDDNEPPFEDENNLLLQEYPDDVLEGSEMENKRREINKKSILALIVIIILTLFLLWSVIGIVLGLSPSTQHINIGFWPFINAIRKVLGW